MLVHLYNSMIFKDSMWAVEIVSATLKGKENEEKKIMRKYFWEKYRNIKFQIPGTMWGQLISLFAHQMI